MGSGKSAHSAGPTTAATIDQKKKPKLGKPTAIEIPQKSLQRELHELNTVRSFASLPKQKQPLPKNKNKLQNQKMKRKNLHDNFSPYKFTKHIKKTWIP